MSNTFKVFGDFKGVSQYSFSEIFRKFPGKRP